MTKKGRKKYKKIRKLCKLVLKNKKKCDINMSVIYPVHNFSKKGVFQNIWNTMEQEEICEINNQ